MAVMLTREQVDELARKYDKIRIFSAEYQFHERGDAEHIVNLCATIRELRELLAGARYIYLPVNAIARPAWEARIEKALE